MVFFEKILGFPGFFGLFWFVKKTFFSVVLFYTETESFDVSIEPKQTEDQRKLFDREYILIFSENLGLFRFVLVCFETVLFVSVVSI